jgi:hypothetical protein
MCLLEQLLVTVFRISRSGTGVCYGLQAEKVYWCKLNWHVAGVCFEIHLQLLVLFAGV